MADSTRSRRARDERASALILFPTAVMVLMVLAAIAVDLTGVHLARRETYRAASQAADDAAAMIDQRSLRAGDLHTIDMAAAARLVRAELGAARLPGPIVDGPHVEPGPRPGTVRVRLGVDVTHLFAKALPGAASTTRIDVDVIGEILEN